MTGTSPFSEALSPHPVIPSILRRTDEEPDLDRNPPRGLDVGNSHLINLHTRPDKSNRRSQDLRNNSGLGPFINSGRFVG